MSTFECSVCGHIEFGAAPDACLVCRANKDAFSENPDAIKRPADPANLSEGDKKHIPVIKVDGDCKCSADGCTCVSATVGEIVHVMQEEHLIRYLDFYLDDAFISRVWLSADKTNPFAKLCLKATSGKVTVVENCNVHGSWATDVQL